MLLHAFPGPDEADLVERLRAAGRLTVSLVAEEAGVIVGHVAFSPLRVASALRGSGLAPLAVHAAARRHGVGARLVREGLAAAAASGADFAVVLGDPAYYARFGFEPASARGLHDTFGGGEAFQVLALRAGGVPEGAGEVRYAPEFEGLGAH